MSMDDQHASERQHDAPPTDIGPVPLCVIWVSTLTWLYLLMR